MSHTAIGPCGLTLPAIIGQADTFGRTMATFGVTDREVLRDFCMLIGERLTKEYLRPGVAHDLPSYEERLTGVVRTAVGSLSGTGLWQACANLGPYDGPALEVERMSIGITMVILGLDTKRHHLGVSASEILDLLAWKQTVLAVPLLFQQEPNLADRLGSQAT